VQLISELIPNPGSQVSLFCLDRIQSNLRGPRALAGVRLATHASQDTRHWPTAGQTPHRLDACSRKCSHCRRYNGDANTFDALR